MTPELPEGLGPLPKTYKRKAYDPNRHCGAEVDRSMEALDKRIAGYEKMLADIQEKSAGREMRKREIGIYKLKSHFLKYALATRQKIIELGPDPRPCMNPKGKNTAHPGTGTCWKHCACKGKNGFHINEKYSYSRTGGEQLKNIMEAMEIAQTDLLDMTPELLLLKAVIQRFANEKQDLEHETIKSITLLQEQIRRTVDSINNKKFQSMISKEAFEYINFRMGTVVAEALQDHPEILEKIVERWSKINIAVGEKRNQRVLARAIGNTL